MPTRAVRLRAGNDGVAAATGHRSCCARNLLTPGTRSYWITTHVTHLNDVNDGAMSRQTRTAVSDNNNQWRTHTRGGGEEEASKGSEPYPPNEKKNPVCATD